MKLSKEKAKSIKAFLTALVAATFVIFVSFIFVKYAGIWIGSPEAQQTTEITDLDFPLL